jgi:hypothetical protein
MGTIVYNDKQKISEVWGENKKKFKIKSTPNPVMKKKGRKKEEAFGFSVCMDSFDPSTN